VTPSAIGYGDELMPIRTTATQGTGKAVSAVSMTARFPGSAA
jgi:hypothetical protein